MKVIVGLGNPGKEYENTRHNAGALFVAGYAHRNNALLQQKSKYSALVAEATISDEKVILVLPTGYYNNSGETVRSITSFYKVSTEDVLIVHDELALPFGTVRTRYGGSDAGNNGVKSISSHVGESTARIRIGVYNDLRDRINDADFVLSRFTKSEQDLLNSIAPTIYSCIDDFVRGELPHTTHTLTNTDTTES